MVHFLRFLYLPVIFLLIVAVSCFNGDQQDFSVDQPLPFNHKSHVVDQELECTFCHTQALSHERATLPGIGTCVECHEEKISDTDAEKQLLNFISLEREIPWQRIYRVPDHVYFSHRRHTAAGEIACDSCHGDVKSLVEPPRSPLMPLSMDSCMDCHEKRRVTNECLSCHR